MLDYIIVAAYLLINVLIGLAIGRKVKSAEQWSMGGKQYSRWIVFVTLSASFIGGGFTIGLSEKTFTYGMIFVFAIWGFSIKEVVIAKYIAPLMKNFQKTCSTAGDIIEQGFGKNAKILTGFASILVCGGIIGAQFVACGNILNIFLGLPIMYGTLLITAIVLTYTTLGGIKSVVALDIMHFIIIMVMMPAVVVFGLYHVGGVEALTVSVPTGHTSIAGMELIPFVVLFLSFFLGETLVPPYMQRMLIGKDEVETAKGTMYAGIASLIFFSTIGVIGLLALSLKPDLAPNLALPFVIKEVLPVGVKGLAMAALMAVVLSSSNSFLNATSVAVHNDILKSLGVRAKTAAGELLSSRLTTFVIGVVAATFSLVSESALNILLYSYQFWTPIILVPLIAAIYGLKSSGRVFVLAGLVGIGTVVAWEKYAPWNSGVDWALEGVIVGICVNALSLWLFHKMDSARRFAREAA